MSEQWDVTLVTYDQFPDLSPDDHLLADALTNAGYRVRAAVWTSDLDWSASPSTLVRSTWDYFHRPAEFRHWIEHVSKLSTLFNSPEMLLWNMDKRYLTDLSRRGIPIVPTSFLKCGDPHDVSEIGRARGWDTVVVKPTISGSAFGAKKFDLASEGLEASAHVRELGSTRDMMVQPYITKVETDGERSLVFIRGLFSHSIRKSPFSAGAAGGESKEQDHDASLDEREFGRMVLDALETVPLYARVDIVPSAEGSQLMELELIEPALFFGRAPGAAEMLVTALSRAETADRRSHSVFRNSRSRAEP